MASEHPEVVERLKGAIQNWLQSERRRRPQLLREGQAELDLLKATGYAGNEED